MVFTLNWAFICFCLCSFQLKHPGCLAEFNTLRGEKDPNNAGSKSKQPKNVENLFDGTPRFKQIRTQDELHKAILVSLTYGNSSQYKI
jgi:hypothetical protein